MHRSGTTFEDTVKDALKLYEDHQKKAFTWLSCWTILRHAPKWLEGRSGTPKKRQLQREKVPTFSNFLYQIFVIDFSK